jgi:hypothetical protein
MRTFRYSTINSGAKTVITPGQVEPILRAMQSRPAWDELQVSSEDTQFPLLNVSWHSPDGFVMQCFERPESNSDFLTSQLLLSPPSVYVELGGQTQELWPKELFVPLDLACQALDRFVITGQQQSDLTWVGISNFPRRTVRPRRQK